MLPTLAIALLFGGNPEGAQEALDAPELRSLQQPLWTPTYLPMARAWCVVAEGDQRRGHALFREAANFGEEIGDLVGAATALHALARTGDPRSVVDRLDDLAERIEGPGAAARATHCRALVNRDLDGLTAVTDTYSALGAHLLAAEAAADTAMLLLRAGSDRPATAATRRAADLARACGEPTTPALTNSRTRVDLTTAERETAILASAGFTSKQIAERLVLSARTIDNRLRRVYEKLGIAGRSELNDALGSPQPTLEVTNVLRG